MREREKEEERKGKKKKERERERKEKKREETEREVLLIQFEDICVFLHRNSLFDTEHEVQKGKPVLPFVFNTKLLSD